MTPSRKRKAANETSTKTKNAEAVKLWSGSQKTLDTKNSPKSSSKTRKKNVKQHGLAAQDQIHRSRRNKMLVAVLIYIAVGAVVLIWKGMTKLPEIPPELENEILGSYPQQLKDIEMPKNMKKQSSGGKKTNDNIKDGTDDRSSQGEKFRVDLPSGWREIKPKNKQESSVGVFVKDNFLSPSQCDELIKDHQRRLKELKERDPIICFHNEAALTSHMAKSSLNWSTKVTTKDFMKGTDCLNATLSSQLKNISWSHSTSLYEEESNFVKDFDVKHIDKEIENVLNEGKVQITSYGIDVAHFCKENIGTVDPALALQVYLEEVDEKELDDLGDGEKPRKGTAVLWFHIDSNADPPSSPIYSPPIKGAKHVLRRRYYSKDVSVSSKRPKISKLPEGVNKSTPRVVCGPHECGSCWWYDDWD